MVAEVVPAERRPSALPGHLNCSHSSLVLLIYVRGRKMTPYPQEVPGKETLRHTPNEAIIGGSTKNRTRSNAQGRHPTRKGAPYGSKTNIKE